MIQSSRLTIQPLAAADNAFIFELVNSPGWKQFIGERHVHTLEDADAYIQKILHDPKVQYWVVRSRELQEPVGVVTLIKRDYLDHHDIGFAFLPQQSRQGFAFEASVAVLQYLLPNYTSTHILATTLPDNVNSIGLLEKLGLRFDREIQPGNEPLLLFAAEKAQLSQHLQHIQPA